MVDHIVSFFLIFECLECFCSFKQHVALHFSSFLSKKTFLSAILQPKVSSHRADIPTSQMESASDPEGGGGVGSTLVPRATARRDRASLAVTRLSVGH